jgi:hypothetical protein
MTITLRDGTTVEDPRLDRIAAPNPEALAKYPIRGILGATQKLKPKTWEIGAIIDQGREGACVGFGLTAELAARPYAVTGCGQDTARPLYYEIQRRDEYPGGEYPGAQPRMAGTSVEAGIKLLLEAGHYTEYRWAQTEQDIALAIGYKGPVVLGIDWYESMYRPDRSGYIRPTGRIAGGHCILAYGIDIDRGAYLLQNSWGADWGMDGTCYLTREDMARLLAARGEACLPVRSRKTKYAGPV